MTTAELSITTAATDPASTKADVLVVGIAAEEGSARVTAGATLGKTPVKELTAAVEAIGFTGKAGAVARIPSPKSITAGSVLLAGLGSFDEIDLESELDADAAHEALRRAAACAVRSLTKGETAAIAFPALTPAAAEATATGAVLGAYRYTAYRTDAEAQVPPAAVTVLAPKGSKDAVARGQILAAATNRSRDLVNQPPLDLYPETFAAAVKEQAKNRKVKVTVIEPEALQAGGYGGLIGVGQGSPRGPRLVKLEYKPRKAAKHLALVGKGITFDSGGLSLKPPQAMEEMKCDMGGAAAAAQAVFAAADLELPVRVTAWLALAENMPGGNAQRPSDVIRIYGGKTVEVLNTDAEGRLVLADALVAAQEEKPDLLIDIATLTGAQVVALGSRVSGVMGTNGARNRVVLASEVSGEPMWPMPFPEEIRSHFDSTVADLKNTGKREAGMLAAGVFLNEFVSEDQQWAHIDIAGPAFNSEGPWGYTAKGGTGVPVRTLVEVAAQLDKS